MTTPAPDLETRLRRLRLAPPSPRLRARIAAARDASPRFGWHLELILVATLFLLVVTWPAAAPGEEGATAGEAGAEWLAAVADVETARYLEAQAGAARRLVAGDALRRLESAGRTIPWS